MASKIVVETREDNEYIYRKSVYTAEKNIADYITTRIKEMPGKKKYDKQIELASQKQNLTLSETQKKAITTCLNSHVSVITGGPGTGKTTIIKCIITILIA